MTLVFGMKLASAAPILLTFDWTGQCDDCQGPNGAIDVPGTNWNDGYTQDVSGLLKINYDSQIDPLSGSQFEFVSFVYNGSSIMHQVEALATMNGNISHAFTIVDDVVTVTGSLGFLTREFQYKGDHVDLSVGDESGSIFECNDNHECDMVTFVVEDVSYRFTTSPLSAEFNLAVSYDTSVRPGGGGGGGGGSRDAGGDSSFVMRGVLPSPLANPIPEPSTIAIFALGMLGLSLRRQKRS